jgi:hypothetical protein
MTNKTKMHTDKSLFTNGNNMPTDTFVITIISRMLPSKSLIICMSLKYKATNVTEKNIVMFISNII